MRALIKFTILSVFIPIISFSQSGKIIGKVTDIKKEGVPFASIAAYQDTAMVLSTMTDIDGNFVLASLAPGMYSVKATCVGYQPSQVMNIEVAIDKSTSINITFEKGVQLNSVNCQVISYDEIQAAPLRDVNSIASQAAGVFHRDRGRSKNVRGSRSDGTAYYVDGVKIRKGMARQAEENDEEYDRINENEFHDVHHTPLSTFSIDVDAASYSNMRRFIMQGSLPPKDAVRIEEMINYFSYHYLQPANEDPFSIASETATCPWNEKHLLVKIGLNGKAIATENLPANNLVFLVDVSGSMNSDDKLPLVKRSLHLLVEQLRSQDRVAIVVYAGNAGLVLKSTKGSEKEKILAAIDALDAGGSTAGGEGIELAYQIAKENFFESGNNRVILATDGDFNVGPSSDDDLVKLIEEKRGAGIFLTVLGFGTGNYKDSKMEKLADKGNGNFAYVDNIMEAKKVFVKEMGATLTTIAKDVKLQVEFNPSKVKAYRLVGYENRILEDKDFNDDKKDAGELGAGSTVTALYELIPSGSDEKNPDIDSLKYQQTTANANVAGNELLTVKFRYKEPGGSKSKLIEHPVVYEPVEAGNVSIDFRFTSAVAAFGLLLRDSKFKGTADYKSVLALAKAGKGEDEEGYRAEFIRLVEMAQLLDKESERLGDANK